MSEKADVVIFGSGFGGSILAAILRRLGRSVILIDKSAHPRFAIGESSTPLANLLMEQIAVEFNQPWLKTLSTWGSWQKIYPEISCGLKRGFTFVQHLPGQKLSPGQSPPALLVAASPVEAVADTHWYRAEFDHFLAKKAAAQGAILLEQTTVSKISRTGKAWQVVLNCGCRHRQIQADFLVDASGGGGVLRRHFKIPAHGMEWLPRRWTIFCHFTGVERFAYFTPYQSEHAGYEGNDAALHHVLEGGWIWVLRFNNGITSAGAVLNEEWKSKLKGESHSEKWAQLLKFLPAVQSQFEHATAVEPFRSSDDLSWRVQECVGEGWAMLPSAAGFIDPLLSSGFALTLLGVQRIGQMFKTEIFPESQCLADYQNETLAELEVTEMLVAAMFKALGDIDELTQLALLYFAAASYAETVLRVRPTMQLGFLLASENNFQRSLEQICRDYLNGTLKGGELASRVRSTIEPFDIAGLTKANPERCYGVNLEDLFGSLHKLPGVQEIELRQMIAEVMQVV